MGIESPKFENKIETESESEPERLKVFESWQELTVGEVGEQTIGSEKLDNEQYKEMFYETIENRLDKTIDILGIDADKSLVEKLNQAEDEKQKTETQKQIIKSVSKKISSIPMGKWAFYPKEIEREKKLNCSGSALVCGSLLNKLGIKTEYGSPAHHAMNFTELADGSVMYVDSRNNIVKEIETEEETFNDLKIRRINDNSIEYKIVPSLSQKDAVAGILGNIEALKTEAKKEDSKDSIAKEIYEKDKELFNATNYFELNKKLYPSLNELRSKEEWKEEEKRINKLHDFNENLIKIKEEFEELPEKEQEQLKKEVVGKKELLREFLISDAGAEKGLSKSLFRLFSNIKQELTPLKNWNKEEYKGFVENLLDKTNF